LPKASPSLGSINSFKAEGRAMGRWFQNCRKVKWPGKHRLKL
jgi:hypothetical protein